MMSQVEEFFRQTKAIVREYTHLVAALIQTIVVVSCIFLKNDVFSFDSIECIPFVLIEVISFLRSLVPCIPAILVVT